MGKLDFTTAQVQQRLARGYYDDIKAAGYAGTKEQLDTLLARYASGQHEIDKGSVERVLTGNIRTHTHDPEEGGGADVWDGVTISNRLAGSGTREDPWLVRSCADFLHMNLEGARYGFDPYSEENVDDVTIPLFFARITTDLDFGGHAYSYPSLTTGEADDPVYMRAVLGYVEIDGQGIVIRNMDLRGGLSPFFCQAFCHVHDVNIKDCEFSTDVNKGVGTYQYSIFSGEGMTSAFNFSHDCSSEATFRITGTLQGDGTDCVFALIGVFGLDLVNNRGGAYYGNNKFVNESTTGGGSVSIGYAPMFPAAYGVVIDWDLAAGSRIYDVTPSVGSMVEPAGFNVAVMDSGFGAPIYYNSDTTVITPADDTTPVSCIGKTTAELKSPGFLALLNGGTDTFVADTRGVNGGYPVFKEEGGKGAPYDGYVRKSEFDRVVAELRALIGAGAR